MLASRLTLPAVNKCQSLYSHNKVAIRRQQLTSAFPLKPFTNESNSVFKKLNMPPPPPADAVVVWLLLLAPFWLFATLLLAAALPSSDLRPGQLIVVFPAAGLPSNCRASKIEP